MSEFKVTFNQNVKLGKEPYRKGESVTVPEAVCDELVGKGVIDSNFEPVVAAKKEKAGAK